MVYSIQHNSIMCRFFFGKWTHEAEPLSGFRFVRLFVFTKLILIIDGLSDGKGDDFMNNEHPHTRCEICGGEDCGGVALSRLQLSFGYGSRYDGEQVELTICGDCADKLYKQIYKGTASN